MIIAVGAGGALARSPSLSRLSLRAGDVPGFHAVSAGAETFRDAHDQGPSQAFARCSRGVPLLSQFDRGPDAVVSVVYGRGTNAFGTPKLGLGSVVFGDGSQAHARTAFAKLSSRGFERCWARTSDSLNARQGVAVPRHSSTVARLPLTKVAKPSAAFAIDSEYDVLGTKMRTQVAVSFLRRGSVVVMLIGFAVDEPFPASIRETAASRLAHRLNARSAPTRVRAASCDGSRVPRPAVPILTDQQATAALHQGAVLAHHTGGATPSCQWNGHVLPPGRISPYQHYQVQLFVAARGPFGSVAAAHTAFTARADAFGPPTSVPGIGSEAAFAPGQDEITSQLVVRARHYVFTVSLQSPLPQSAQDADLTAVAADILARLGQAPATHFARRWSTDWAGSSFCHTRRYGTQYLHTTWHGVAACGARYPQNFQGTIAYRKVTFDTDGFQCVELAERYFYYVTGLPGPFANGSDLAEVLFYAWHKKDRDLRLYPTGVLGRTSTYQSTLVPGDIISMWSRSDSVVGHVAVVIGVSLHPDRGHKGKSGTITVLNENTVQSNGVDHITVTDGHMWFPDGDYYDFQWLSGLPARA